MSRQFYERISSGALLTALLLILSTAALSAGTKSEKIDKIVKEYYDACHLNGVVLVAEKGKIISESLWLCRFRMGYKKQGGHEIPNLFGIEAVHRHDYYAACTGGKDRP